MGDINKYLLSGSNPGAKLATLRPLLGPEAMQGLAESWIKDVAEQASTNPEKALQAIDKLSAIPGNVRAQFLGPRLDDLLENATQTYRQSVQYAEEQAANRISAANESESLANRAINSSASAQRTQNSTVANRDLRDITTRSNAANKALDDALKEAEARANAEYQTDTSSAAAEHRIASAPLNRPFIKSLLTKDVNENLARGNVDVNDIKAARQVIGDDKWKDVSAGVFQRAVADAGSPIKVVEWWEKISPAVREEMFSLNNPAVIKKYNDYIASVEHAASYQ
jgi:hypothetical protein